MCIYICIYTYACIHICIYIYICIYVYMHTDTCRVQNPDIPRAGRGGAAHGRAGRDVDGSVRRGDIRPSCPPEYRRRLSRTSLRKHEQSNSYLKPTEEQNPRLTPGLSVVHPRFISRTKSVLCSWMLTSVPALICLCKPFSCKACPGIYTYMRCIHMCNRTSSEVRKRYRTLATHTTQSYYFKNKLSSIFYLVVSCSW